MVHPGPQGPVGTQVPNMGTWMHIGGHRGGPQCCCIHLPVMYTRGSVYWDLVMGLLLGHHLGPPPTLIRMRMICGTLKGLSSLCSGTYALHTDMHSFRWSQGGLRMSSWGRDSGRVSFRSPSGCGHHQDHDGCGSWWVPDWGPAGGPNPLCTQ